MHRRPICLTSIISVLVVSGNLFAGQEPTHEGKSLSQWFQLFQKSDSESQEEKQAATAIQEIGTNATPYLISWIKDTSGDFYLDAPNGFKILGEKAAPAIPELDKMLRGTNELIATLAATALGNIGKPALPVLLAGMTNENQRVCIDSSLTLCELGTNAEPVIPILLKDLDDNRWKVRQRAVVTLQCVNSKPEIVVPALIKHLDDPVPPVRFSVLEALAEFGPHAKAATTKISRMALDENENMRRAAKEALSKIDPEAVKKK